LCERKNILIDSKSQHINVLILNYDKIEEFCTFVRTVYDEFVSGDYNDEGNTTFYNYIHVNEVRDRLKNGNIFYIAEDNHKIVGAIEIRNLNHISLLFVDKDYQKKGIAKKLFNYSLKKIIEYNNNIQNIEVNSSPYAKEIYKKIGFMERSELVEKNGIKYYEMEYQIK
jgi:ribosomal protein S18 acetylase RimI-like enzyme